MFKKIAIKTGVLTTVFILAVIVSSYVTNRGNTDMSADMGGATLPRISFNSSCSFLISTRICATNLFLYFGINTMWYWHFHRVCDKLLLSIWTASFDFEFGLRHHSHHITGGFILLSSPSPLIPFSPA